MTEQTPVQELSYEQAFAELETIIANLESDERSLEEALAHYERGQALVKHCASLLEQADLRIQKLAGDALTEFEA